MKERVENSNKSNSMAKTTAASGAPKVADIPAAAPADSNTLRSAGETGSTWPINDPSAPPVTMIGPSAPKGPPVPMATAADSGFASAARGEMRLWRRRMASIASGMPWPLMTGDHRASVATTSAPATAATNRGAPGWSSRIDGRPVPPRWNRATLVRNPIRWTSTHAAPPATRPMPPASPEMYVRRRTEARGPI